MHTPKTLAAAVAAGLMFSTAATAERIKVTIENVAVPGGVFFTPIWVGFHDGSFDIYDSGSPASPELESLAEDGDTAPIAESFTGAVSGGLEATIVEPGGFPDAPVFDPESRVTQVFDLDPSTQRYMSYASMLLPSNDAFFANADPQAIEIFDEQGNFNGPVSFLIRGRDVRDAGTEANTESDAAFFNQSAPNTGDTTAENIAAHPGFNGSVGNPDGTPMNILGGTSGAGVMFDAVNADFSRTNYRIARVTIAPATESVAVTVANLQPASGLFLTPPWVGFHDGSFDLYDIDAPASAGLESLAEDGDTAALSGEFAAAVSDGIDATVTDPEGFVGAPLFDPGASETVTFDLDPDVHRYMSYASMVIPSNDAFIANGNPMAVQLFDESGTFLGPVSFDVAGNDVRDAGTEENTESDAAFLNQSAPNTGTDENGTVQVHPGLNGSAGNPDGTPVNILGATNDPGFTFDVAAADFTRPMSRLARVTVGRAVDGRHSGTWYNAQRSGEGLMLELVNDDNPTAVVSFYTYTPDGTGDQVWLIGSGPLVGDTAIVDLVITDGTSFGDGFSADDVNRTPWGQMQIQFTSDTTATMSYESELPEYGSATRELTRLTAPLIGR